MNTTAITGTVATSPRYRVRAFVPTTDFDVTVEFARRSYTFHVRLMNDLAKTARRYVPGDHVAVVGYLHSEPFDMPDCSVWHRVEIVGYEIEHQPASDTQPVEVAR
jgi:hypothetical protein